MVQASSISTFEPVGSGVRSLSVMLTCGTWQHDISSDVDKRLYKSPPNKTKGNRRQGQLKKSKINN